jgi:tripartite-type tricarboxylate transporter receptor subunit TctC
VPTFGEAGYPALAVDSWFAFFVQGATPQELKSQIHAEINKVLADPAIVAQLSQRGAATMSTNLDAFQKIVDQDMETWGATVRASGAKID